MLCNRSQKVTRRSSDDATSVEQQGRRYRDCGEADQEAKSCFIDLLLSVAGQKADCGQDKAAGGDQNRSVTARKLVSEQENDDIEDSYRYSERTERVNDEGPEREQQGREYPRDTMHARPPCEVVIPLQVLASQHIPRIWSVAVCSSPTVRDRGFNAAQQRCRLERFDEWTVGASSHHLSLEPWTGPPGDHDYRCAASDQIEPPLQFESTHFRHVNVGHDAIDLVHIAAGDEALRRYVLGYVMSMRTQQSGQRCSQRSVVIDNGYA